MDKEEILKLVKEPNKKRKDCKYYIQGKCDLLYQMRGQMAGYPFNSSKYGWMWKCHDNRLGRPCESYIKRV